MESLACQDKQFGIGQLGNGQPEDAAVYWNDTDKEMLLNWTIWRNVIKA